MNNRDSIYFSLKEKVSNKVLSNIYKLSKNTIKEIEVYNHFNINVSYLSNSWWNKTHLLIYKYNELVNIIQISLIPIFNNTVNSQTSNSAFKFSNGATFPLIKPIKRLNQPYQNENCINQYD